MRSSSAAMTAPSTSSPAAEGTAWVRISLKSCTIRPKRLEVCQWKLQSSILPALSWRQAPQRTCGGAAGGRGRAPALLHWLPPLRRHLVWRGWLLVGAKWGCSGHRRGYCWRWRGRGRWDAAALLAARVAAGGPAGGGGGGRCPRHWHLGYGLLLDSRQGRRLLRRLPGRLRDVGIGHGRGLRGGDRRGGCGCNPQVARRAAGLADLCSQGCRQGCKRPRWFRTCYLPSRQCKLS